jgi:hypothetical protein
MRGMNGRRSTGAEKRRDQLALGHFSGDRRGVPAPWLSGVVQSRGLW